VRNKKEEFDIEKAILEVRQFLAEDKSLSPAVKAMFGLLMTVIALMSETINELNKKLGLTSKNSSKPPSSDSFGKGSGQGKSGRPKGTKNSKKNGGTTLRKKQNPDEVVQHKLVGQCPCGQNLGSLQVTGLISRQVWGIILRSLVTEHQAEQAICACGKKHTASFPEGVSNHVQYSSEVKALINYLSQYQLIPFERTQEIFKDLFDLELSDGTIFNSNQCAYSHLNEFEDKVKVTLAGEEVANVDETKINIAGKLNHLHVFSNEYYTYLKAHKGRGHKAMDDIGLLKNFKGVLVHDRYSAYNKYECSHALCGSHLLRDLTFCEEMEGQRWAHEMRRFLEALNELQKDQNLTIIEKDLMEREYTEILLRGQRECPPPQIEEIKRKNKIPLIIKKRKTKSRVLLEVFKEKRKEILRFMHNPLVPFTNNLGERDLRMLKVQQKISGCFRSLETANIHARIRSYISTVKKQEHSVLRALANLYAPSNPTLNQLFA